VKKRTPIVKKRIPIKNRDLLRQALTHRSSVGDDSPASNERLEFFGDSVLGVVISEYMFQRFPQWDQGALSKAKSAIVQESSLAEAGRRLGLDEMVIVGSGEEAAGGRRRTSILADAYEAVIGAVYLDRGFKKAHAFVLETLDFALQQVASGKMQLIDAKSKLQEITQARWKSTPVYRVTAEHGLPHEPSFEVEVLVNGTPLGQGSGRSKKEAEQAAAARALAQMHNLSPEE
jgi:ribonuclease-3